MPKLIKGFNAQLVHVYCYSKSRRTGYVSYEDDAPVLAEPYYDVRLLL